MVTLPTLLLLCLATASPGAERALPMGLPPGVTLALGQTIHHVVFELGPPDDTRLAGELDGAYAPSPGDALVLFWRDRDCQFGSAACSYWAVFPSGSAELSRLHVDLARGARPSLESLREDPRVQGREVRFRLIPDSGDIEAEVSECTAEDEEVRVLVVPEVGLDAFIEHGSERVELLSYSLERLETGWPVECDD